MVTTSDSKKIKSSKVIKPFLKNARNNEVFFLIKRNFAESFIFNSRVIFAQEYFDNFSKVKPVSNSLNSFK